MGSRRFFRKTGKKTGQRGDDGAVAPHAGGGGEGSRDPSTGSADGCVFRLDGTWAPVTGTRPDKGERQPEHHSAARAAR